MSEQQNDLRRRVENDFTYHESHGDQAVRYARLRYAAKELAMRILDETPVSREQSLALTRLEECVFWGNAAIARNE